MKQCVLYIWVVIVLLFQLFGRFDTFQSRKLRKRKKFVGIFVTKFNYPVVLTMGVGRGA